SRSVWPRLTFRADEILERLADAPDARVSLSRCPEQLNNFRRENRRIQKRPTFIQNRNTQLPAMSGASLCHRVCDQHAHRGFKPRIRAESFDIEEQPRGVGSDTGVSIEQF